MPYIRVLSFERAKALSDEDKNVLIALLLSKPVQTADVDIVKACTRLQVSSTSRMRTTAFAVLDHIADLSDQQADNTTNTNGQEREAVPGNDIHQNDSMSEADNHQVDGVTNAEGHERDAVSNEDDLPDEDEHSEDYMSDADNRRLEHSTPMTLTSIEQLMKPRSRAKAQVDIGVDTGTDGIIQMFTLWTTTPMKKLMDCYCNVYGKTRAEVDFIFNGTRIEDVHDAETLGIWTDDAISVHEKK